MSETFEDEAIARFVRDNQMLFFRLHLIGLRKVAEEAGRETPLDWIGRSRSLKHGVEVEGTVSKLVGDKVKAALLVHMPTHVPPFDPSVLFSALFSALFSR